MISLTLQVGGASGGTGQTFDWSIVTEVAAAIPVPVVVAGGLTPDNVADAVAMVTDFSVS